MSDLDEMTVTSVDVMDNQAGELLKDLLQSNEFIDAMAGALAVHYYERLTNYSYILPELGDQHVAARCMQLAVTRFSARLKEQYALKAGQELATPPGDE